ncbi:MAG: hypothetical protein WEB57_14225 [Pseudohongiellaceae bacterium]
MSESPGNNDGQHEPGPGNESGDPEGSSHALRTIRLAKQQLLICFLTFPVYAWGVVELLNAGNDITLFMLFYMAIYAGFGINASVKRCPRCHKQFYVAKYFLNIFGTRCKHCGLSYHTGQ